MARASHPGTSVTDGPRFDDLILAALLLLIGVPRAVIAVVHDRPLGVEGTLSLVCVGLGLLLLAARIRR